MTRTSLAPMGYAPARLPDGALAAGARGRAPDPACVPQGAGGRLLTGIASYPVPPRSFVEFAGTAPVLHLDGVLASLAWGNTWPSTALPVDAYRSLDGGATWERKSQTFKGEFRSGAVGNGRFVALTGNSFSGKTSAVSFDGINWTSYPDVVVADFWYGLTFGDGLFRAGGYDGHVATSADGQAWTMRTAPGVNAEWSMYGAGVWLVGGRTGSGLRRSLDDGQTWVAPAAGGPSKINGGLYTHDAFWVRDVDTGQWWRSPDGDSWAPAPSLDGNALAQTSQVAPGTYLSELQANQPLLDDGLLTGSRVSFEGGVCFLDVNNQIAAVVRPA